MNASIYNSDLSALRKQVRHVGHKIDRALESHSDIVSLRIICSLLQNRIAKLAGCLVSFRGGGGKGFEVRWTEGLGAHTASIVIGS